MGGTDIAGQMEPAFDPLLNLWGDFSYVLLLPLKRDLPSKRYLDIRCRGTLHNPPAIWQRQRKR
jgi:hypothetical protein